MKLLRIWHVTGINTNSPKRDNDVCSKKIITINELSLSSINLEIKNVYKENEPHNEAIDKYTLFLTENYPEKLKLITGWVCYVEEEYIF